MAGRVCVFPHHRLLHESMAITKGMRKCVVRAMREPETTTAPGPEPAHLAPAADKASSLARRLACSAAWPCRPTAIAAARPAYGPLHRVRQGRDRAEEAEPRSDEPKEDRNGRGVESGNKDADSRGATRARRRTARPAAAAAGSARCSPSYSSAARSAPSSPFYCCRRTPTRQRRSRTRQWATRRSRAASTAACACVWST